MNNINELRSEIRILKPGIKKLLEESHYIEDGDLKSLQVDETSPDQIFIRDALTKTMDAMDRVYKELHYMELPVLYQGELKKQPNGRYTCEGYEITCGEVIEILVFDDFYEREKWVKTSVEYNTDYYVTFDSTLQLEGLQARIRG